MSPLLLLFHSYLLLTTTTTLTSALKKSYIVYLGAHSHSSAADDASLVEVQSRVPLAHYALLGSVIGSEERARESIFYSYTRHINGFAASLEDEEAAEIEKHPEVISVFPNRERRLHTTHSWRFLRLERDGRVPMDSIWNRARFGEDTIIGNLDTGVWPESESFSDDGMGPIPSRWKGICQSGVGDKFTCNRKLIGARYFNKGYAASSGALNSTFYSPRDIVGHGTHTLSTAGGRFVPGANVFGFGNGTAKGGSPLARVAAYRVCYPAINSSACFDADILAAFDAAIDDGVDVLSVSLGGKPTEYFSDGLSIGSFHAVRKGVTVIMSAGNRGPKPGSVSNLAPWMLTVGASTMDRKFPSCVALGSGKYLEGQSLCPYKLAKKQYPLINSTDAKAANASLHNATLCFAGSLNPKKVKGKIVACLRGLTARVAKGETVLLAGGAGMILVNDVKNGNEVVADAHVLPATHMSYPEGLGLSSYMTSTKFPTAYITYPFTKLGAKPAPFMAAFSSQGPNPITPEFLKPDVTAPGVSVIAAYGEAASPTGLEFDKRRVAFNSQSGTSMSCPHVAGVVGLLKTLHPHWSPSAIRSAIMTTARVQDNMKEVIRNASFIRATPFSYGSGHIRPNRAMDPGLVYDITSNDYLNFLCSIGYNSTQLATFSTRPYKCPSKHLKPTNLNYPSITIPNLSSRIRVTRTVKNVGSPGTYKVRVLSPLGVSVSVRPSTLNFTKVGEEKRFKVTFEVRERAVTNDYVFGRLIWSDGVHYVRSPLVVKVATKSML